MLHPVLMNIDTFICTLREAAQLVDDVNRGNFGLVADVWHLWHEVDIAARLEHLGERIFLAQLSDWPHGGPRTTDDRVIPGEGKLDLPGLVAAIRRAGYTGPWELEILSDKELPDSLWRAGFAETIQRSQSAFARLWQSSESRAP
ncbi:MAG: sugar phosphate isomerase/epimerase [Phycisphaerales bacterium]|nr:sugar phosphate isomerase/epimerase [Phycisphaerales bacterium]